MSGSNSDDLAQESVDDLIRVLASGARNQGLGDRDRIRARLGEALFNPQLMRVPVWQRGTKYLGRTIQARDDSAFVHLARRVLIDRQWANGTTVDEYVSDLRYAASDPDARIVIYDRGQGPIAGAFSPNRVPVNRVGTMSLPWLYVVYSADRSSIVTGYQVSGLDVISVSGNPLWLA